MQREVTEILMTNLLFIYIASAMQHGLGADQSSNLGQSWAAVRALGLGQGYAENTRDRTELAGREWREKTDRGKPPSASDVGDRLVKMLGPSRTERIVVSETTSATTAASEAAIIATVGKGEADTWFTENDASVCPVCKPLHGKKRSVWTLKFPDLPSNATQFPEEGPPAHWGCRCWIHYANEKRGAAAIAS